MGAQTDEIAADIVVAALMAYELLIGDEPAKLCERLDAMHAALRAAEQKKAERQTP